jgi:hypothetical protein
MNPITPRIGTVFVPVSDVEAARDWYCRLLGVPADGEILFGHLYVLPVEGTGLVLDSRMTPQTSRQRTLLRLNWAPIRRTSSTGNGSTSGILTATP